MNLATSEVCLEEAIALSNSVDPRSNCTFSDLILIYTVRKSYFNRVKQANVLTNDSCVRIGKKSGCVGLWHLQLETGHYEIFKMIRRKDALFSDLGLFGENRIIKIYVGPYKGESKHKNTK